MGVLDWQHSRSWDGRSTNLYWMTRSLPEMTGSLLAMANLRMAAAALAKS